MKDLVKNAKAWLKTDAKAGDDNQSGDLIDAARNVMQSIADKYQDARRVEKRRYWISGRYYDGTEYFEEFKNVQEIFCALRDLNEVEYDYLEKNGCGGYSPSDVVKFATLQINFEEA